MDYIFKYAISIFVILIIIIILIDILNRLPRTKKIIKFLEEVMDSLAHV